MRSLLLTVMIVILLLLFLFLWRRADDRALATLRLKLANCADTSPAQFDPRQVDDLPEPARRFLVATIKPGTPLHRVVEIEMRGEFSLGSKEKPNYIPMHACQLLAPPYGFVWVVEAGRGLMKLSGSDAAFNGTSWTRFWLDGLIPVARAGNTADHLLSSFGRYMAESIFWAPSGLMPSETVTWEGIGTDIARVTVAHNGLTHAFDITVNAEGHPTMVKFQRWSNANEAKIHQCQPFGGYLSDYKEFGGLTLPTTVTAGNFFGTDKYFPFFKATVESVRVIDDQNSR